MSAMLQLDDVARRFGGGRTLFGGAKPTVHAVRGISLTVARGETLGIVGESGCGKSTLARMVVGLDHPSDGTIRLEGSGDRRASVQYVFQDCTASLNPRKRVRQALSVPLTKLAGLRGKAREARLTELMETVNLDPAFLDRYPHELSGGQAQRIGIARALAAEPDLLVLDEPVSALDVSMQAQVLELLADLKARLGLTYVFISHDLSVIESVSGRVAILYFGKLAEIGPARAVYAAPQHPYTALLLASAPAPRRPLDPPDEDDGTLPDPYDPPPGCAFAARCPRAEAVCREEMPPLAAHGGAPDHQSACHFPISHGAGARQGGSRQ